MGNPITWFEVNGPEPEQTAKFYSEVFGWHTETVPGNYILIDTHSGAGMNGGIGQTREGQPPHSVFFVENPDIQKLLDQAEKLGAKTVVPVTEIPDMVTFAQFTDPFGNLVGLVKGDGQVKVSEGSNPPVDWAELSCADPKKAWDFWRCVPVIRKRRIVISPMTWRPAAPARAATSNTRSSRRTSPTTTRSRRCSA